MNRIFKTIQRASIVTLGLALMAPVAASAQDAETVSFAPATVVLKAADGTESQYQVNDISFYVSSTEAYDDVPASTDMSLSITTIAPIDAALLAWIAQTTSQTKDVRDLTITTSAPNADGTSQDLTYEVAGAHVTSISVSHSTMVAPSFSLSVSADKLTLDGVALN